MLFSYSKFQEENQHQRSYTARSFTLNWTIEEETLMNLIILIINMSKEHDLIALFSFELLSFVVVAVVILVEEHLSCFVWTFTEAPQKYQLLTWFESSSEPKEMVWKVFSLFSQREWEKKIYKKSNGNNDNNNKGIGNNGDDCGTRPPEKKTMELKLMALTWITMNDQTNEKKSTDKNTASNKGPREHSHMHKLTEREKKKPHSRATVVPVCVKSKEKRNVYAMKNKRAK